MRVLTLFPMILLFVVTSSISANAMSCSETQQVCLKYCADQYAKYPGCTAKRFQSACQKRFQSACQVGATTGVAAVVSSPFTNCPQLLESKDFAPVPWKTWTFSPTVASSSCGAGSSLLKVQYPIPR
jgi:hypothetical protein